MKPKKSQKEFYILFGLLIYLPMLYLGFCMENIASSMLKDSSFIEILQQTIAILPTNPMIFLPISGFHYPMIMTLLFIFTVLILYVEEERNAHFNSKATNGTAEWNSDRKKFNKIYRDMSSSTPKFKLKLKKGFLLYFFGKLISFKDKKFHMTEVEQPELDKNMIISHNYQMSMNTRQTKRNNNVIIYGGAGTGKSRFLVKPNLLQANASFVVTDPSGELLRDTGHFLKEKGYKIKIFNLVQMTKSNQYNPFNYIRDEAGVMSMVNCLFENTNDAKAVKGDPFWEKSETALIMALCYYLAMERPKKERNFSNVMKLLRAIQVDEMNPNAKSDVDRIFDDLKKKNPNHIAVKYWTIFKQAGGKTAKSILISASVRLAPFNIQSVADLTDKDDIELGRIGDEKTALFVIIPTADTTYNFLVSLMYSQLFETLYYHAENECESGRLPFHVRFMLDEFANIGRIPKFEQMLATMRKYEISCTIILQSASQLESMYEKDASGMEGNCDTMIFLGSKDINTLKKVSELLGKATIDVRNRSMSRGSKGSSNLSFNSSGRELLDPAELGRLDNSNLVFMIRGEQPFMDKKFKYETHKNYKYTYDANKKFKYVNTLDTSKKINYVSQAERKREEDKTIAYVEASENKDDPNKQLIGTMKKIEKVVPLLDQMIVTDINVSAQKQSETEYEIQEEIAETNDEITEGIQYVTDDDPDSLDIMNFV